MVFKWNESGDKPPSGGLRVAARKCKVCEWEGELAYKEGEELDCPWCHAPTEPIIDTPATKNPHAAALGRLGGLKGGQARAKALSAAQRKRIASRAARARWAKAAKTERPSNGGKKDKKK
jgi:hypothetical protein